jgi:hypothetical protein
MNTLELCAQITANGFLPSNHPNFSLSNPTQLIKELNGCVTQNFERPVVNARSGYWLKSTLVTTVAGRARYPVPHRAAAGGLERVEIAQSATSAFAELKEESGTDTVTWEGDSAQRDLPRRFELRGDQIHLLPTPDSSSYVLRLWYYLRPSQLAYPQSPTYTGVSLIDDATVVTRGQVQSINVGARQVVVTGGASIPFRMRKTAPSSIISGVDRVDIVHSNGWHELALVDAPQTFSGSTITIGGSDPLDDIVVGDYVRFADETDWPCVPTDFHRLVADLASMTVLVQLHMLEKARAFGEKASGDMDRFRDLLQPRVKNQLRSIPFPEHVLNGSFGGWR